MGRGGVMARRKLEESKQAHLEESGTNTNTLQFTHANTYHTHAILEFRFVNAGNMKLLT